jgi:hypothetical protein
VQSTKSRGRFTNDKEVPVIAIVFHHEVHDEHEEENPMIAIIMEL